MLFLIWHLSSNVAYFLTFRHWDAQNVVRFMSCDKCIPLCNRPSCQPQKLPRVPSQAVLIPCLLCQRRSLLWFLSPQSSLACLSISRKQNHEIRTFLCLASFAQHDVWDVAMLSLLVTLLLSIAAGIPCVTIAQIVVWGSGFSTSLPTLMWVLKIVVILWVITVSHCNNLHFPDDLEYRTLFHVLIAIHTIIYLS